MTIGILSTFIQQLVMTVTLGLLNLLGVALHATVASLSGPSVVQDHSK